MAYSTEMKERAVALYGETPNTHAVARQLGCGQKAVWRWVKAAGALKQYTPKGRPRATYDPAMVARAVARCVAGEPPTRVAIENGVGSVTLERWIAAAGATLPPPRHRAETPSGALLTWEQIMAPGPGHWDMDELIRISEARNAAIAANPSGFPREQMEEAA